MSFFRRILIINRESNILLFIISLSIMIFASYSFVLKINEVEEYKENLVDYYYIRDINSSVFKTSRIQNHEFWGIIDYTKGEVYFDILEDCKSSSNLYSKLWTANDIDIEIINQFINSNEEINLKPTFSRSPVISLVEKYLSIKYSYCGDIQKLTNKDAASILNNRFYEHIHRLKTINIFYKIGGFIARVELRGDFHNKKYYYLDNGFKDFHFNRVIIEYVEI